MNWAEGGKIQIDIVEDDIGRNRPIEVGIVADAKMALHGQAGSDYQI